MDKNPDARSDRTWVIEQIISAVVVAQIVTVNTLHGQAVIERRHFAHAFARVIDALAANPNNRLLIAILQVIKNSHMQTGQGEQPDIQAWIRTLLDKDLPPDDSGAR